MNRDVHHNTSASDPTSATTEPQAAMPAERRAVKEKRSYKAVSVGVGTSGSLAVGAIALGALAIGAVAIGALAIGSLAVKRLAVGRSRFGRIDIDELRVRRLRVEDVTVTKRYRMPDDDA